MDVSAKPNRWQVAAILFIGILAISTSAIFIRSCIRVAGVKGVGFSLFLAASRLMVASLILLPAWKNFPGNRVDKRGYYCAVAAGVSLAVHFSFWITSLSYTSIAAATALVTTNPIWVAILSRIFFKEKISQLAISGMAIAIIGGIFIAFADRDSSSVGANPLLGDSLAALGGLSASIYFLCALEARRYGLGIGIYITMAYTIGAIILLPLPLLFGTSYAGYPALVYFYILLMAVFPQLIGHTSFNWAVGSISPTIVSLCTLFEPIGSSLLGALFFQEIPSFRVILGGLMLLVGVGVALGGKSQK